MDQELELASEDGATEIRSALWQKFFVAPLILLFCGMGVIGTIGALYPQLLESRPHELPDVWTRVFTGLIGGPLMFRLGLYLCQVWFYRLRADELGLTESLGWKETRVFWSDVHSYSMEPGRNHKEAHRYAQPVLRDAQGTVLLRPVYPVLVSDEATLKRRVEFWSFVQSRLAGKETPYVPPTPHPLQQDNWKGKSTRWKIKRTALLGFGTLSFIGLWTAASLWAISQPALPRWVVGLILAAVLWVPLVYGAVTTLIIGLHERRQRRDEASSAPQVLEAPDLGIT